MVERQNQATGEAPAGDAVASSWRRAQVLRSERMERCCMYVPRESAYAVLASIGELGLVQFDDMNKDLPAIQKKYNGEISLCTDLLTIAERIRDAAAAAKANQLERHQQHTDTGRGSCFPACSLAELMAMQVYLEECDTKVKSFDSTITALTEEFENLKEHEEVLRSCSALLTEATAIDMTEALNVPGDIELAGMDAASLRVHFLSGIIPIQKRTAFEKLLWRTCRGNVYFGHRDIVGDRPDAVTGQIIEKAAFVLLVQGQKLKAKAEKICDGFRLKLYSAPKTEAERQALLTEVIVRKCDLQQVVEKTTQLKNTLVLDAFPGLEKISIQLQKCRAIYVVLNMFEYDQLQKSLRCCSWHPAYASARIRDVMASVAIRFGYGDVPCFVSHHWSTAREAPPTLNRVNKVTKSIQALIDSYGVNTYEEVNPAPFTAITFPFLFAVMFGDFGHGLLITAFALAMVISEKALRRRKQNISEVFRILFDGRYLILLMGLFSMYTGLIYNEAFSKPITMFRTQWKSSNTSFMTLATEGATIQLNPINALDDYVYPFGQDPVWSLAANRITFTNSYKMKLSVILGVGQMIFGILLSILNFTHFHEHFNLVSVFIPEMLFICCLFGYLVVLIVAKWTWYFENTSCAPSLLIGFISMFLMVDPASSETAVRGCAPLLYSSYQQQRVVEEGLLFTALLCVPWLLLMKPFHLWINGRSRAHEALADRARTAGVSGSQEHQNKQRLGLGEAFMHQAINTIEYCLGCVSHTASYLRLWALSLAHVELSEVLWDMVLRNGLAVSGLYGGPIIFALFPIFAALTVAILLLMEGLSAFLHTLRLHWVEFQTKFYRGDGLKFSPFDLQKVCKLRTN